MSYHTEKIEELISRNALLRSALERLASPACFIVARVCTDEETARLKFAADALVKEAKIRPT